MFWYCLTTSPSNSPPPNPPLSGTPPHHISRRFVFYKFKIIFFQSKIDETGNFKMQYGILNVQIYAHDEAKVRWPQRIMSTSSASRGLSPLLSVCPLQGVTSGGINISGWVPRLSVHGWRPSIPFKFRDSPLRVDPRLFRLRPAAGGKNWNAIKSFKHQFISDPHREKRRKCEKAKLNKSPIFWNQSELNFEGSNAN